MMISENCSLLPYNTFGIQALARVLVTYDSADELRQALSLYRSQYAGLPLLHIGAGSNLLFLNDYPGSGVRVMTCWCAWGPVWSMTHGCHRLWPMGGTGWRTSLSSPDKWAHRRYRISVPMAWKRGT